MKDSKTFLLAFSCAVLLLVWAKLYGQPAPKASRNARVQRPATMPASAPATRAATTRPASQPSFTPLADAVPGEWALYTAEGDRELRYEVRKVSGAGVSTEVTVKQGGKPLGLPAIREDPSDYDPLPLRAGAQRQING